MTPYFLINKLGYYFMLTNEVAEKMIDVSKLTDCQIFDNMGDFYNAVHERHPDIDDINVLMGSYIELWYDDEENNVKGDHSHLDHLMFDLSTIEQDLSEFGE